MKKSLKVEYLCQEGNPLVILLRRDDACGDRGPPRIMGGKLRRESNIVPSYDGYSSPVMFPGEVRVSYNHHCKRNHPVSLGKRERVVF